MCKTLPVLILSGLIFTNVCSADLLRCPEFSAEGKYLELTNSGLGKFHDINAGTDIIFSFAHCSVVLNKDTK